VPGVRTSDISVMVDEHTLRITGETKTERRHACVHRSIELPKDADFSSNEVKVAHEDGILSISVPKREPQRRQLMVSTPDPAAADEAGDSAAEDDKMYHVTLAVPGVRTSDISVMVDEHTLRITGETKTERRHACVHRSIELPKDADFSSNEVKVTHEVGILSISVPKREPQRWQLVIGTPKGLATTSEADDSATAQEPKCAARPSEVEQSFA